jgi:hypothetical protein
VHLSLQAFEKTWYRLLTLPSPLHKGEEKEPALGDSRMGEGLRDKTPSGAPGVFQEQKNAEMKCCVYRQEAV